MGSWMGTRACWDCDAVWEDGAAAVRGSRGGAGERKGGRGG